MSTHTLSLLVENRPGVLARISGLFARRGFNIDSLAVGPTEEPSVSRMTIVVSVDTKTLEQVAKQVHKLINVLRVVEHPPSTSVERELALIKVAAGPRQRAAVLDVAAIFRAKVVDVSPDSLLLEASGEPDKIEALEELVRPYGIVEVARTGRIALARGTSGLKPPELRPVPAVASTAS